MVTSEILTSIWCVGEICTAKNRKVRSLPVLLSGGDLPDDEFLRNYEERVPTFTLLSKYGIDVDVITDSLQWLREQPHIVLKGKFSSGGFQLLSERLAAGAGLRVGNKRWVYQG